MKKKISVILLSISVCCFDSPAMAWVSPSGPSSAWMTVKTRDLAPLLLLQAKSNKQDEEEFKKMQQQHHDDDPFASKKKNDTNKQTLAKGKELKQIRDELRNLRESLMWAAAMHDDDRVQNLMLLIESHEKRDPEHVYAQTLSEIANVQATFDCDALEKAQQIQTLKQHAQLLRSRLPRFQMEGLWVGAFGENDLQLVNITYRGDTLVATKTTGDTNVPRGQVSFTADLSPPKQTNDTTTAVTVTRYQGQGQVAQPGFVHHKYVNGHLLLVQDDSMYTSSSDDDNGDVGTIGGCYPSFSFVWYAERQHKVVFTRPTPQQTLHLLRDTLSREDELENMRTHLTRCLDLDATDALARHHAGKLVNDEEEPFRRIRRLEELEQNNNIIMNLKKKKNDGVLKKEWGLWRRYLSEGIWKNLWNNHHQKKENGWDDFGMGF